MIFHDYYDIVCFSITLLSLFLQTYVMFLIICVSPPSMKEYRIFIGYYTFWDGLFVFSTGILMQPRLYFPSTGCIVQGIGKDLYDWLGPELGEVIAKMTMVTVVCMSVSIITAQDFALLYRYSVISSSPVYHEKFMKKKTLASILFFGKLLWLPFSYLTYKSLTQMKNVPHFQKYYIESAGYNVFEKVAKDAVWTWFDDRSGTIAYLLACILGGFVISEIFCITCGYSILKTLKINSSNFSYKTYQLHRQLTILLILQLSTPLLFFILPVSACTLAVAFRWNFSQVSADVGYIFVSFYSSSNSFLAIFFVTPYRKFTFKIIQKILPFFKPQRVNIIATAEFSTNITSNSQIMDRFNK